MGLPRGPLHQGVGRRPVVRTESLPRGEKQPRPCGAAYGPSVHADVIGRDLLQLLKDDATAECDECGMPMFPTSRTATHVHLDCANRHFGEAPLPREPAVLRLIDNWISKRGAQLHVQHERWGTDEPKGRDARDI